MAVLVLLKPVAAEVGSGDEVDEGPPNRDLLEVEKLDVGFDVAGGPKGLAVELPNEVVLLLLEVEKRGVGVVLPKVELLSIDEAKTFEVLVGLVLGAEGFSAGGLRENIPDGAPNEEVPDEVEEKALWNAKLNFTNMDAMEDTHFGGRKPTVTGG
jgi:hypothetical protein